VKRCEALEEDELKALCEYVRGVAGCASRAPALSLRAHVRR
jgi:hypothetical protein